MPKRKFSSEEDVATGKMERIKKTQGVFNEVSDFIDLAVKARSWIIQKRRWSVSISSDDRLYEVAHNWFRNNQVAGSPPRALAAHYLRPMLKSTVELDEDGDPYSAPKFGDPVLDLYYDDGKERRVTIDGHKIMVKLHNPTGRPKPNDRSYRTAQRPGAEREQAQPAILNFFATSRAGQQAVLTMLESLLEKDPEKEPKPALFMLNRWADWGRRDDLPARRMESVVLADGQMERLRDDIKQFLKEEQEYIRRGIPWHRGYLLEGPPGTGKTSIVRALAHDLKLNLWYAPLGDLEKDAGLLSVFSQVPARSILLLEDIDVFHAATTRNDETKSATMAGLLNALDGVATPHGLITFLTTNDVDAIDEALLRPGRVDLVEHIGMPTPDQLLRLWAQFYNEPYPIEFLPAIRFDGSTAAAVEIFKQYMRDPEAALKSLTQSQQAELLRR